MKKRHKKKQVFEGWTCKDYGVCWTILNTLNIATVIQKTKPEAAARYEDDHAAPYVTKVRITIEDLGKS